MGNGSCMCTTSQLNPVPTSTISLIPQKPQEYLPNNKSTNPVTLTPKKARVTSQEIKLISLDTSSYESFLLEELNQVRVNPQKYALKLTQMLQYISETRKGCLFSYPDNDMLIIKSGKELFLKTIDYLNALNPVPELEWNEDLKIIIRDDYLPLTDEKIVNILIQKRGEVKAKYPQCVFNYDFFSNPELSVVFQVTDELFKHKRRDAMLCSHFKYFAVGYIFDPIRKFVALMSFA